MDSQEYQDLINEMKKDKEGGGTRKYWSPPSDKEGNFPLRFLPPVKKNGEKVFYFHHKTHWIDGKSYECLKQSATDSGGKYHEAEDCPACALSKKLYDESGGNKESEEFKLAYELSAKDRYIYRVIVRGRDKETQPVFFESGKKLFENLFHILTETDFGPIIDLKEGRDFNLVKKGTGRRSNYDTSTPAANTSIVFKTKEEVQELITNLEKMSFNQLIDFTSYDNLKKVAKAYVLGEDPSDDDVKPAAKAEPAKEEKPVYAEKVETKSNDDDDVDALLSEFDV